ncbi:MAG: 3-deoxy-D-manno-octulosonic acid transferase [Chlorobi bacterium]|nr:3-deoxy-D-manno-octulosonic acid transferase [Chlorobiota bacterium]
MAYLYRFLISTYGFFIRIAAPFSPKARAWLKGRKDLFHSLSGQFRMKKTKTVWFHCASLGEFEQGRPVIERFREEMPGARIILTFFSPSGFDVRKNYPRADRITYLPLDTPHNARRFLDLVQPDFAVFIKYEYWYFFLKELHQRNIPVFLISAIFRPRQLFFRWYGRFYLKMLQYFTKIFVQDKNSLEILEKHGIRNVVLSGDTRFDRVVAVASRPKHIPVAERFATGHTVVVAGSTWPGDETLLIKYIVRNIRPYRWIIAPHEIHKNHLSALKSSLGETAGFYSKVHDHIDPEMRVLIIDNVGMLSSLYALADIAYIGGGFGKGIHNILEAAVFGVPVIFGPHYSKFREANELTAWQTAFPVSSFYEFEEKMNAFFDNPDIRKITGEKNHVYVDKRTGSTEQIVNNMLMFI